MAVVEWIINALIWAGIVVVLGNVYHKITERAKFFSELYQEIIPFYWIVWIVDAVVDTISIGGVGGSMSGLLDLVCAWLYYRMSKDNDGRWKKRRQKLAEKVSVGEGKLVVVPAEGS